MPSLATLDVKVQVAGEWRAATLMQAHGPYRDALKRCPSCGGRVTTTGSYGTFPSLTLAHRARHRGCPRDRDFTGTPSPHPRALP